jgi:hypothetical protein
VKSKKALRLMGGVALLCLPEIALTQDNKNDWNLAVSYEAMLDNNATRAGEDGVEPKVSEQQNTLGFQVRGDSSTRISALQLDYQINREEFTKESQPDGTTIIGGATLSLGTQTSFYGLTLEQESSRVLKDPSDELTTANSEQRNTVTIKPMLRTRSDKRNVYSINGFNSDTVYDSERRSDVTQSGIDVNWLRKTPSIYRYGLTLGQRDVSFQEESASDYSLTRIEAALNAQSRLLGYRLVVGSQRIEPAISPAYTKPFYSIDTTYEVTGNTIVASSSSEVSNTSLAEGVSDDSTGISIGGDSDSLDQFEVKVYSVRYANETLCRFCTVSVAIVQQEVSYVHLLDNDYDLVKYDAFFDYRLSKKTDLRLTYSEQETRYNDEARNTGNNFWAFSYNRDLLRDMNVQVQLRNYTSDSLTQPFSNDEISIRISKIFN